MAAMQARPRGDQRYYTTTALCVFAALAGFAPNESVARDRPGTPNNETSYACKSSNGSPAVCVEFANTATERVFFESELTVNGEVVAGRPEIDCIERRPAPTKRKICVGGPDVCANQQARNVQSACHAGFSFNGRRNGDEAEGKTGEFYKADDRLYVYPEEAFKVVNLDYETQYCFRFRARRTSDQVVSANWSNWTCTTTPAEVVKPQVRKPGPPSGVTAEFVPGGKDFRTDPPKVIVTWQSGLNATSHSVDKKRSGDGYRPFSAANGSQDNGTVHRVVDELSYDELAIVESEGITYRVCAVNSAGTACSQKSTYAMLGGVQDRTHAGSDVITQNTPPPITATPPPVIPHGDVITNAPDAIGILVKPRKFPSKIMTR